MTYAVGTHLRRRTLDGSAWDDLRVVGVYDLGPNYGHELVVQPWDFGPTRTVIGDTLYEDYEVTYDDHPATAAVDALEARLAELEPTS